MSLKLKQSMSKLNVLRLLNEGTNLKQSSQKELGCSSSNTNKNLLNQIPASKSPFKSGKSCNWWRSSWSSSKVKLTSFLKSQLKHRAKLTNSWRLRSRDGKKKLKDWKSHTVTRKQPSGRNLRNKNRRLSNWCKIKLVKYNRLAKMRGNRPLTRQSTRWKLSSWTRSLSWRMSKPKRKLSGKDNRTSLTKPKKKLLRLLYKGRSNKGWMT